MKARSYAADFEIKNGELIKYKGEGGKVTVPDGVTRIGDRAFYNCGALESVVVTGKVKVIGENAFYNCAGLTAIYCHGKEPASVPEYAFNGVRKNVCRLFVPAGCRDMYRQDKSWQVFTRIEEMP